jgi:hypothetical protein
MSTIVNSEPEFKLQYQATDQYNRLGKMDMLTIGLDDCKSWWSGYVLSELFPYLVLKSPSDSFHKIENLRCNISNPLTMNTCSHNKAKQQVSQHHQKCWCDLIRQMIENGTGNTRFILRNMNGHGIAMNISCKIWKCTYQHSTLEERLTNWKDLTTYINVQYSLLPVDKDIITIKQIYYVDDTKKMNIIKSDHELSELWFNSIEFTTRFLPEDFKVTHQNLSYKFIKYNCLIANDLDSKDLCGDDPDSCWCDVINMLRSTGSAVTDIELSPCSGSYNQHPAIVRFSIKVNPSNPDLLNIKMKFIFDETKYKFKQNINFRRRGRQRNFYYNNSGSDNEYDLENLFSDRTDDF